KQRRRHAKSLKSYTAVIHEPGGTETCESNIKLLNLNTSPKLVREAVRKIRRDRKLRQLDLANLVNVDHTLISRIETGRVTADPSLIKAIRAALQLSESEWKWLETCVARCALDNAGITEAAAIQHQDLLDISTASLRAAVELRSIGNSVLAANTTYPTARALSDTLATSSSENSRRALSAELCELLFHEAKCYLDYLPPEGISRLAVPVASRLFALIGSHPTARNNLLGGILKEGLLYFDKQYSQADQIVRDIFALRIESEWRPEIVRAAAINAGYLGDEVSIRRHEKEMRQMITAGVSPLDHVFMLDGLARGYARLGKPRAVDIIEEAWDVQLSSTVQSTLRYVQKVRAHLEVNDQLGRAHDTYLITQAKSGLKIARSMGYERYVQDLIRLAR
ncbi:MAG: helix-turn-helix domain-containing protein, partial [Candidatus Binatia bacterium]